MAFVPCPIDSVPVAADLPVVTPVLHFQRKLLLGACALGLLGTFLSALQVPAAGVEAWSGVLLFGVAGAFACGGVRPATLPWRCRVGVSVPSVTAAFLGIVQLAELRERMFEVGAAPLAQVLAGSAAVGAGLYASLFAGAGAAVLACAFPSPVEKL